MKARASIAPLQFGEDFITALERDGKPRYFLQIGFHLNLGKISITPDKRDVSSPRLGSLPSQLISVMDVEVLSVNSITLTKGVIKTRLYLSFCTVEKKVDPASSLTSGPNSWTAGGTDTSEMTVEWAISDLLKQPQHFQKAREELDRVIGRDRWVEEDDIPNLPYIGAIPKEVMRLHPAATLLALHLSIEDCKVASYDIPKGTTVLVNVWTIGRHPRYWEEPERFRPERFLGKNIDMKGHHFELLPFGSGWRMCPAYRLGLKLIHSTLANLVQRFNWKLPDNVKPDNVDMEEEYGLTTHRKIPIVAVIEPQLSAHLYV
ncbi:hypothetical protein Vadar_003946 [Vaccinium darrowii]|uniref:Uncharacterized protein n=1 Tax=Vaccinium darrowii TaxID=229202 RepID=A0ACB7WXT0_9ERIC|nr:hypothetical protein Vadar_003946 [Vaccinium darrowii]